MEKHTVASLRLHTQWIAGNQPRAVGEVVTHLGAIQAQDYPGALWSLGLRTGKTLTEVEAAVASREIVRTWPMRGTLHFVPAEDTRWMLELTASRILQSGSLKTRQKNLELDEVIFKKAYRIFEKQLSGDKQLTRTQMCRLLEQAGIVTVGQRGIHILSNLCMKGLLCFGAHQAKEPTFALLHEYVPAARSKPRAESLALLTRRYFTSHGPAAIADFVWWSGLTTADAKAGLALNADTISPEKIDGKDYWFAASKIGKMGTNQMFLLPGFDEFLLGYRDRSAALPTEHSQKIVPGNNGMFLANMVWNGQIIGLWKKTVRSSHIKIEARPFLALTAAQAKAFNEAATRYAGFLGSVVHFD